MSNIEGEKMMGEGAAVADVGIVRGPKGQATDLAQELRQLIERGDEFTRKYHHKEVPPEQMEAAQKLALAYRRKLDETLLFLLDQFSK